MGGRRGGGGGGEQRTEEEELVRREGKRALATKAHLTLYSQHFKPESQSCCRSLACHVMLERIVFHGSMRLGQKKKR